MHINNYLPKEKFETYQKKINSLNPILKFLRKVLLGIGTFEEYKLRPEERPEPPKGHGIPLNKR